MDMSNPDILSYLEKLVVVWEVPLDGISILEAGGLCLNQAYLIFVIFFTQSKILDRKFYTEERVIYGKRISRQNSVNCDLLVQANYKHEDHEKKGRQRLFLVELLDGGVSLLGKRMKCHLLIVKLKVI